MPASRETLKRLAADLRNVRTETESVRNATQELGNALDSLADIKGVFSQLPKDAAASLVELDKLRTTIDSIANSLAKLEQFRTPFAGGVRDSAGIPQLVRGAISSLSIPDRRAWNEFQEQGLSPSLRATDVSGYGATSTRAVNTQRIQELADSYKQVEGVTDNIHAGWEAINRLHEQGLVTEQQVVKYAEQYAQAVERAKQATSELGVANLNNLPSSVGVGGGDDFNEAIQAAEGLKRLGDKIKVIRGTASEVQKAIADPQTATAARQAMEKLRQTWEKNGITLKKYKIQLDAANQALRVTADLTGKIPGGGGEYTVTGSIPEIKFDVNTLQEITKADEVKAYMQQVGIGAQHFKSLEQAAQLAGFSIENYKNAQSSANDKLHTFNFQTVTSSGAINKHNIIMNRQGEIVNTVKQKYETLAGAIGNSIQKVIRWGIAVGLVYGTLNKLREAVDEMINLQVALADIQVITGRTAGELGDSMDAVIRAAERTGTTLGDAVATYEKALRAAGQYRDENVRLEKAQTLVTDALTLARLANISSADAMDKLTGALRQQGLEIDQGQQLLDKWVATSKIAYTSISDLAESFAITASQARSVGVNVDTLNGIIGTLAEVTTLSSTEIGNLARTMLSALESETAVQTLREYGVAVKGANEEFRSWHDVIQDLFDLFRSGAINERDLSAIGRALGGGARRGPQIVAFIKEYGRVNEIASESANASGEAAEALDIKMDTLRNTVKELQVALSTLASAAGEEGGLLDFLTRIAEIATTVTKALSDITSGLGDTTTQLLALAVAWQTYSRLNIGGRLGLGGFAAQGLTQSAAQWGAPFERGGRTVQQAYGPGGQSTGEQRVYRGVITQATDAGRRMGQQLLSFGPQIGQAAGISLVTYLATGDVAQSIGSGIGGVIGSVLAGTPGLIAGTVIGNVIVSKLQEAGEIVGRDVAEYMTSADAEAAFKKLAESQFGAERIFSGRSAEEYLKDAVRASQTGGLGLFERNLEYGSLTESELRKAVELQERITELKAEEAEQAEKAAAATEGAISPFAEQRAATLRRYAPGLRNRLRSERGNLLGQLAGGNIPRAEYTRFLENAQRVPQVMAQIFTTLESEVDRFGGKSQQTFEELGLDIARLDPEAIQYILDRLDGIAGLQREFQAIENDATATASQLAYSAELQAQAADDAALLGEEIQAYLAAAEAANKILYRPSFTRRPEELTFDLAAQAEQIARENQATYAKMFKIDPAELARQADPIVDVIQSQITELTGLHRVFWDDAVQIVLDAVQKQQELANQFSVRRLQDVSPERFGEIQARNRYWIEYLARLRGQSAEQYLSQEGYQENLILGPNNVWQKLLTTNEAMSFTLQDILETEKQQLEGMWNIPTGATFWVPLTSLFYQRQQQAGGVPNLPPIDEDLVDALTGVSDALEDARLKYPEPITAAEEKTAVDRRRERLMERERFQRLSGGTTAPERPLETKAGSELINAIESIALKQQDPAAFLANAIRAFKEYGQIEDEKYFKFEGLRQGFTEAIKDSLGVDIAPLFQAFKDTQDGQLDTHDEIGLMIQAIQELVQASGFKLPATGAHDVDKMYRDRGIDIGSTLSSLDTGITALAEKPEAIVNVNLPDVSREINIQNTVTLDGSVIKRYISRVIAQEIGRSVRSKGFGGNLSA